MRFHLLLAVLLAPVSVLPGMVTAETASDGVTVTARAELCDRYDASQQLTLDEMAVLWSDDRDHQSIAERQSIEERCGFSPTETVQLLSATDASFDSPPAAVLTWNHESFRRFAPVTGISESLYPNGAARQHWRYIKDAHASIYSLGPSTRLTTDRETRTYASSQGYLRAFIDYRVELPHESGFPSDPSHGDQVVFRSLDSTQIVETRLKIDGRPVSQGGQTQTPVFHYELPRASEQVSVSVEADLFVQVSAETWRYRCTAVSGPNNTTRHYCYWTNQGTRTYRDTRTVSDSQTVIPYPDPGVSVHAAEFPNGELALRVDPGQHPFAKVRIGEQEIPWKWGFYSAGAPDWRHLYSATGSETTVHSSSFQPVQTHAFIRERGVTHGAHPGDIDMVDYGSLIQPADLPIHIDVPAAHSQYKEVRNLTLRYPRYTPVARSYDVIGLVADSDFADRRIVTERIHRTVLNVEPLTTNRTHSTVRISLRDASGTPIALVNRGGYLSVAGQQLKTDHAGHVTVTLPREGFTKIQYHPADWLTSEPSYAASSTMIQHRPDQQLVARFLTGLDELAMLSFPFLVFLYAIHGIGAADVWPPWKLWNK